VDQEIGIATDARGRFLKNEVCEIKKIFLLFFNEAKLALANLQFANSSIKNVHFGVFLKINKLRSSQSRGI
jgi:hypothetical protein